MVYDVGWIIDGWLGLMEMGMMESSKFCLKFSMMKLIFGLLILG